MSEPNPVQEVSTREGYARWASSYDEETNALVVLEETHVDPLFSLLHMRLLSVSARAGPPGTVLWQCNVEEKQNEISALNRSFRMGKPCLKMSQ